MKIVPVPHSLGVEEGKWGVRKYGTLFLLQDIAMEPAEHKRFSISGVVGDDAPDNLPFGRCDVWVEYFDPKKNKLCVAHSVGTWDHRRIDQRILDTLRYKLRSKPDGLGEVGANHTRVGRSMFDDKSPDDA